MVKPRLSLAIKFKPMNINNVPEHAKFDKSIFELIREINDFSYVTIEGDKYFGVWGISKPAQSIAHRTNPPITTRLCSYCSKQAEHYHHPDYSEPEAVIPVCEACHAEIHDCKLNRRGEWIDKNYYWNN